MLKVRERVEPLLMFRLRSGSSSLLYDLWLSSEGPLFSKALAPSDLRVADFVRQGCWDVDALAHILPPEVVNHILSCGPPQSVVDDALIWKGSSLGMFSVSSAFHLLREHGASNAAYLFVNLASL